MRKDHAPFPIGSSPSLIPNLLRAFCGRRSRHGQIQCAQFIILKLIRVVSGRLWQIKFCAGIIGGFQFSPDGSDRFVKQVKITIGTGGDGGGSQIEAFEADPG